MSESENESSLPLSEETIEAFRQIERASAPESIKRFAESAFIDSWTIKESRDGKNEYCIIGLPGRGNKKEMMLEISDDLELPRTMTVSIEPKYLRWYPQPYSPTDQQAALGGIPISRKLIFSAISKIHKAWGIPYEKMILMGFSAGGVMAIDVAAHAKWSPAAVIVFGGAILDPNSLPQYNKNNTKFLLQHNKDDSTFSWEERYLPMKAALLSKGYPTYTLVKPIGDHTVSRRDVYNVSLFLREHVFGEDFQETTD